MRQSIFGSPTKSLILSKFFRRRFSIKSVGALPVRIQITLGLCNFKFRFLVGKISKTSQDVLNSNLRKITDDLFITHTGSKITENVKNCNSHSPDAGLAAAFSRFNSNNCSVIDWFHSTNLARVNRKKHTHFLQKTFGRMPTPTGEYNEHQPLCSSVVKRRVYTVSESRTGFRCKQESGSFISCKQQND